MLIDYQKVNIYQDEKLILSDVNFQAEEGQFIYIIGKVGSGKSSLLKSFYCELDIDKEDADKAEVFGQSLLHIRRSKVPALRRQMGIIFQDFQLLYNRTVARNLQFVLRSTGWKKKDEINQRIDEVLEQVGMLDKKDKMPHELSVLQNAAKNGTAVVMSTHSVHLIEQFPGIIYRCKEGRIGNVTGEFRDIDLSQKLEFEEEEEEDVER